MFQTGNIYKTNIKLNKEYKNAKYSYFATLHPLLFVYIYIKTITKL